VVIAVLGALLIMAGLMVGFAAQAGFHGVPGAGVVALGLVAGGLFCGVVLIAASGPPSGAGRRRRTPPPSGQPLTGTVGQPGTSEEWIRALRPGPGDKPGDTKRP
jgi:hypothetical protein